MFWGVFFEGERWEESTKRRERGEKGKRLRAQAAGKPHISISLRQHHLVFLNHLGRTPLPNFPTLITGLGRVNPHEVKPPRTHPFN